MEPEKIIHEIKELPPEAQKELTVFIDFLKLRHKKIRTKKRGTGINLAKEPFIGVWKDRKDMMDSQLWLRRMRKAEWRGAGG
ncbi:MAG: DUF2281 domain-containing protein [Deltaproteobacteria bacterium]|nr:DUF2281 domain-containing protein [Deltaproteobacteria bacterium]